MWAKKQIDFSGPFLNLLCRMETGISRKEKLVFRKEKLLRTHVFVPVWRFWVLTTSGKYSHGLCGDGKIVRGPSTSFLGGKQNRLFGTISGTTFGPILEHIGRILDHIGPISFSLGPGPGPWPPWPKPRGIPAGLFSFPGNGRFLLNLCFMCFLEKVSLGQDFSVI